MSRSLKLGRYDYAIYGAFTGYSMCSLAIPLCIVAMGRSLNFPLEDGGQSAAGTLHLVRSISMLFTLMCCSWIAARWGKRITMGISVMLMGLSLMLCAVAPWYWVLLPLLVFAGLGEGFAEGVATPFVQDLHNDEPERYVSIAHSFWSVGIGLCVFITTGLLALGVSWRFVLGGCGLMTFLASIPFLLRENAAHSYPERGKPVPVAKILSDSGKIVKEFRFWLYCFGMFVGAGSEFGLTFWLSPYLQLNFGAPGWLAGLGIGVLALGMFVGRTVFGYYAGAGKLRPILLGSSLGMIPVTVILSLLTPKMISSPSLLATVLTILIFISGIGIAPYWPVLQVHGVTRLRHLDDTLLYIYFSATGIPGCGLFTWLLGWLGDTYGLRGAFMVVPVSLLLYAGVMIFDWWLEKQERKEPFPGEKAVNP